MSRESRDEGSRSGYDRFNRRNQETRISELRKRNVVLRKSASAFSDTSGHQSRASKQGSSYNIARYQGRKDIEASEDDERKEITEEEEEEEKEEGDHGLRWLLYRAFVKFDYVIHPFSNLRLAVYILTVLVAHMNVVFVPFDIAFSSPKPSNSYLAFKVLTDAWLFIYIIANLKTGFVKDYDYREEIEFNPGEIALRYWKSGFCVDLIAAFPWDIVFIFFYDVFYPYRNPRALKFLRLPKLLTVISIARDTNGVQLSRRLEYYFSITEGEFWEWKRLYHPFFLLWLVTHLNGCIQFGTCAFLDFPERSWARIRGLHLYDGDIAVSEKWLWSIYSATGQMLALSYGLTPEILPDVWTINIGQMTGCLAYAFFVGNTIAVIDYRNMHEKANLARVCQLREYMAYKKFPKHLRTKLKRYYTSRFKTNFNEEEVLSEMGVIIRRKIIWHNTAKYLLSIPFFVDVSDDFIVALGSKLRFTVFMKDDVLFDKGDLAFYACFLCSGEIKAVSDSASRRKLLREGMYFGESVLFLPSVGRRKVQLVANSDSSLYQLKRSDYLEVAEEFPEDDERAKKEFRNMYASMWATGQIDVGSDQEDA